MLRNFSRLISVASRLEAAKFSTIAQPELLGNLAKESASPSDYETLPLTPKYFEDSWNLVTEVFFKEEKACQFLELDKNVEAQNELKGLFSWIIDEGHSLISRDTENDKIVAAILNKKWVPRDLLFIQNYVKKCKNPSSRLFLNELLEVDLFELCKANSVFELFAAACYKDIRGKRLPSQMFLSSIDMAKRLAKTGHEEAPEVFLAVSSTSAAKYIVGKSIKTTTDLRREIEYGGKKISIDYQFACLPLVSNDRQ